MTRGRCAGARPRAAAVAGASAGGVPRPSRRPAAAAMLLLYTALQPVSSREVGTSQAASYTWGKQTVGR